jgi:starch synthase
MGLAGRQRCVEEFSWSAIAAQTVTVYEKAIAAYKAR